MSGSRRVLARAEVTKRLAHGDRYLETRIFLADGRVMEQVNPGVPDLENDWREVGRFGDLRAALDELRRDGWRTGYGDGPVERLALPVLWATDPFRAWVGGLIAAAAGWSLLTIPIGLGFALVPVAAGSLALYALAVRPRGSAASGVLLGTSPYLAWGVIDGLRKCARFNASPGGGCESDPTAQVLIATAVYVLAMLATGIAARTVRTR